MDITHAWYVLIVFLGLCLNPVADYLVRRNHYWAIPAITGFIIWVGAFGMLIAKSLTTLFEYYN